MLRRIKTFEDAYAALPKDDIDVMIYDDIDKRKDTPILAAQKLCIITEALNRRTLYWHVRGYLPRHEHPLYYPEFCRENGVVKFAGVARRRFDSRGFFPPLYYVRWMDAWYAAHRFIELYRKLH